MTNEARVFAWNYRRIRRQNPMAGAFARPSKFHPRPR
jgi:hypothetical protein